MFLIFLAIYSSCITPATLHKREPFTELPGAANQIGSIYENRSQETESLISLWQILSLYKNNKIAYIYNYPHWQHNADSVEQFLKDVRTQQVALDWDGHQTLTASLIQNDILVDSIQFYVFEKNGNLIAKRHFRLIPIPFIWFRYDESLLLLTQESPNRLTLVYGRNQFGWMLLAVGQKFSNKFTYKMIKK